MPETGDEILRRRTDQNNFKSSGYLWPMLVVAFLVIILIGGVAIYHHYETSKLDRYPYRGVSVTQQDGYVDFFSLAKTGQKFVYIRASQGSIYTDNNFDNNYQRAEGSGLDLGVLHVFSFNSNVRSQFRNFKNQIATKVGTLPIAVQVNRSHKLTWDQLKSLREFINMVKAFYQKPVIIWTKASVARQLKLGRDWIDSAFDQNEIMTVLNPKETLNLNGQDENVTQMVFNGNRHNWRNFSRHDHLD